MGDLVPRIADARPWDLVGVTEVSLFSLAEDLCRISLERGDATDVLHLRYDELGTDRDVELSATTGSDAHAARAALVAAARVGHFALIRVVTGGLLSAEECSWIIHPGEAERRTTHQRARHAPLAAEAARPSRILATVRAAGLTPSRSGRKAGSRTAPAPGTPSCSVPAVRR